jgi:Na+-translocating ferredoxin:NAD+ oxidoreductase RnfG subunit
MSEIKGQILGIIIVLMIFGVVSGAMVAMFNNLTKSVSDNVAELASEDYTSHAMSMYDRI